MVYRVDVSPQALRDARNIYEWISTTSETTADNWFRALLDARDSLSEMPNRCPIAPESRSFPIEVRQLLFKVGNRQWRIVFGVAVDEFTAEDVVRIYRVRDSRQKKLNELEILG